MARPHPSLIEVAAGRPLPPTDDPRSVLRSAVEHRFTGLLLSAMEPAVPRGWLPVVPFLRRWQAQQRAWHEQLWATLSTVTGRLAEAGIDVAAAKGVAAERRWYDHVGDRPSSDLDLVLAPGHLDRLDDAIALLEPSHPLCGKAATFARRGVLGSVDVVFEGVPIDLHVDALKLGVRSRNRDAIWERTVALTAPDGAPVRALDAESSLLLFLVHLNKDRFHRLLGFADVARLQAHEAPERRVVAALATADGISTSVDASWNVVVDALDLPAAQVAERRGVRRTVWHVAWSPDTRLLGNEGKLRFRHRPWLIPLLARGRVVETARGWARTTFPPREVVAYAHSEYATRWGGAAVADAPRSYLAALTAGRARAVMSRRRAVVAAHEPPHGSRTERPGGPER